MASAVIIPSEDLKNNSIACRKKITKNCKITTPGFVNPGPLIGEFIGRLLTYLSPSISSTSIKSSSADIGFNSRTVPGESGYSMANLSLSPVTPKL